MSYNASVLFSFAIYFIFVLGIGVVYYKRTENISEYILGGRKLSGWVTSLSAQASDMSGWLLLGLPGYAYVAGLEASWIAIGLACGTYLNWKFIAKKLRQYTQIAGDSLTLSDYFENRFRDKSKTLRVISSILILIFFVIYTASGFVAGAKLFSTVFGISYLQALTLGALFIVSYTFLGGFMAVCWTDFFQGIIMFVAITLVPLTVIFRSGGFSGSLGALEKLNPELLNAFTDVSGTSITAISLISLVAWGLGYFGQPHILVRFMATSSSSEIKKARKIAMIWVIISLSAAVLIGMLGISFLDNPLEGSASETVFMVMVNNLFPPLLAGFFLAAILSAIMSTADSQLLVSASAITEDFYKAFLKKNASDKELIWTGRFAVIGVSLLSYTLALNPNSYVLELVAYAWAGFGASFGPAVILSLYWKRMTRNGALAGMLFGGATVIIWKQLSGGIFDLYEIVPGFILSMTAILVFSLMDKQPSDEIQQEFDSVEYSNI